MADSYVRGSRELAVLGRRLKEAGAGDLRKELLRGIRLSAKRAIPEVRVEAFETLPRTGGLAAKVAQEKYAARTALSSRSARVRIQSTGKSMKSLRDIDNGRLRHPLFGNRKKWFQQEVRKGYFSKTLEEQSPRIRNDILNVMEDVARKLARRVL